MLQSFVVAAMWATSAAFAQDTQLAALHSTLVTLHSHDPKANIETLGATPELTVAKHQLRDWIEMQLGSLKDGEQEALSARINEGLKAVDVAEAGDDQSLLGSVGDVHLSIEAGVLIVTSGVGILCQYDESAYAYKRMNGSWHRIWESEQLDYSPQKYAPQQIAAVHVLQPFKDGKEVGPPFVMSLGYYWGCASTWHSVQYRVWRIDSAGSKLLIDESEEAWLRAETYIVGSIGQNPMEEKAPVDVLVEFTARSIDSGVHNREAVRHYLIDGDRVRRVDPVALSPRDFVDEWLTRGWNESSAWTASALLRQWHGRLHADFVGGEFGNVTRHCQTPDLWQVTFEPQNAQKNFEPEPKVHFLVGWRPPYHFTMRGISDKPWPRCTQEDRQADEWRTLFSTQEWRW